LEPTAGVSKRRRSQLWEKAGHAQLHNPDVPAHTGSTAVAAGDDGGIIFES